MGFFIDFYDIMFGIEDAVDNFFDSLSEGVNVLFCDPEIDGKKAGYERASKEYEKVYKELKQEHKEIMEQIKNLRNTYDFKSNMLIDRLAHLEEKRDDLKKKVQYKEERVSEKYNIPLSSVHSAVLSNGLMSDSLTEDIIGMVYDYKKKKLIEAEHRGYVEARELYEDKLKNLKQELREEKRKGYTEIQNLVDLMCDVFEEISGIQMEVAGLEILL